MSKKEPKYAKQTKESNLQEDSLSDLSVTTVKLLLSKYWTGTNRV